MDCKKCRDLKPGTPTRESEHCKWCLNHCAVTPALIYTLLNNSTPLSLYLFKWQSNRERWRKAHSQEGSGLGQSQEFLLGLSGGRRYQVLHSGSKPTKPLVAARGHSAHSKRHCHANDWGAHWTMNPLNSLLSTSAMSLRDTGRGHAGCRPHEAGRARSP